MRDPNESQLNVIASADGDTMMVVVRGEVDGSNAFAITAVIPVTLDLLRVQHVVVDLSGVDFMDSSGISALIKCRDAVHAEGGHFEVVRARGVALRALEVTGVLEYLSSPPAKVHS